MLRAFIITLRLLKHNTVYSVDDVTVTRLSDELVAKKLNCCCFRVRYSTVALP